MVPLRFHRSAPTNPASWGEPQAPGIKLQFLSKQSSHPKKIRQTAELLIFVRGASSPSFPPPHDTKKEAPSPELRSGILFHILIHNISDHKINSSRVRPILDQVLFVPVQQLDGKDRSPFHLSRCRTILEHCGYNPRSEE